MIQGRFRQSHWFAAAFDYQFGALDEGNDNKLFRAYANLLSVSVLDPSSQWPVLMPVL